LSIVSVGLLDDFVAGLKDCSRMNELADFKSLSDVPGFNGLCKRILSFQEEDQKQSYINQLAVAKTLSKLAGLRLTGLEFGNPPKDIIFDYKKMKYVAEIKTICWTNKRKKLNGPPFVLKAEDYFNSNGEVIKELPKELPEIPLGYDLKEIIDTIFIKAYSQLKQNCFNIIFLIVEPWWIRKSIIEDALHEVFVRLEHREFAKRPKLNAIVFCGKSSPPNYVYNNPSAREIDQELKFYIQNTKLR